MERATIAFVGDVMLGRGVNAEIWQRPPEYAWGDTLPVLREADTVIANLECAITSHQGAWSGSPKTFFFRGEPRVVEVLQVGNIGCVSLANNHTLDFGERGLRDTVKYLSKAGIAYVGAGKNETEAAAPVVFSAGSFRVAMIALTDNEPPFAAGPRTPGTNYFDLSDEKKALDKLAIMMAAAGQSGADVTVLSLHWGPNMVTIPPEHFRRFARAAIDMGVDIVHGHSAHVFQGVERYQGGLILYDTGDFLDDYAIDPVYRNDWSFIFLVDVEIRGVSRLRMLPVRLAYAQVNMAEGADTRDIKDRMKVLSQEFETPLEETKEGLELGLGRGRRQQRTG